MNLYKKLLCIIIALPVILQADTKPWEIDFSRQSCLRPVLDETMDIPLAELRPDSIVGLEVMHPASNISGAKANYTIDNDKLVIANSAKGKNAIWIGGCNPFACYSLDIAKIKGSGTAGVAFTSRDRKSYINICLAFSADKLTGCEMIICKDGKEIKRNKLNEKLTATDLPARFYVQMLGSGFTCFIEKDGLPVTIGQGEFNDQIDLREKDTIHSWHFMLMTELEADSSVEITRAKSALSPGVGLADLRAITYQDGRPYIDNGRLWYTISIRGRDLPQHVQGVFSLNPSVFDLKLEGIILFDRNDGLLRNEIASHIFYDETIGKWRGLTTGFTSYADPTHKEKKQIWAVESERDPRFGMSTMKAHEMQLEGNYEDAHIIYDSEAAKWRMLLCENTDGPYRAVVRESNRWDGGFQKIAGPVKVDSTGTQIQKIGNSRYCMFGSADRCMYVFSYPDLKQMGKLQLDLPPWDDKSGTRVWTNVVPLPQGYPARYVALTMDRFNYPGLKGPNWSYGALYLYHGQAKDDNQPYEYSEPIK